jgi:hypothetical protein
MSGNEITHAEIQDILFSTLKFSRDQNYMGWDYWDGMSSRLLQNFPVDNRWLNILIQEGIKRAPVNIRPFLLVEKRESPVGLSLFTLANQRAYEITGEDKFQRDVNDLAKRVSDHGTKYGYPFSLYHNHEIQGLNKKKPIGTPRIVATVYGVKALLESEEEAGPRTELAHTVYEFVQEELDPIDDENGGRKIKYTPLDNPTHYTINANALAGRMFVDLFAESPKDEYRDFANDLLQFVSDRQEPIGGWQYRDPPSKSHLSMDNHHNGYIIESFLRYRGVFGTDEFDDTIENGLDFYRNVLFEQNGAPNWDESNSYPKDITAAAQGIIVFSLAGDKEFAKRIIEWTTDNLYGGEGQFYYQSRGWYTKRFTLMRWCQAWMAYALSEYLAK